MLEVVDTARTYHFAFKTDGAGLLACVQRQVVVEDVVGRNIYLFGNKLAYQALGLLQSSARTGSISRCFDNGLPSLTWRGDRWRSRILLPRLRIVHDHAEQSILARASSHRRSWYSADNSAFHPIPRSVRPDQSSVDLAERLPPQRIRTTPMPIRRQLSSPVCDRAGCRARSRFVNHKDVAGGSTLGNILTSQIPLRGVDMGAPCMGYAQRKRNSFGSRPYLHNTSLYRILFASIRQNSLCIPIDCK